MALQVKQLQFVGRADPFANLRLLKIVFLKALIHMLCWVSVPGNMSWFDCWAGG